jgi:CPA1 family monovalent cation:H+ antiporter
MNGVQLVLVVLGAIVVTAYARRRALQPALVITVVGLAASFIPGVPRLELEPDIVLSVLVPPLIYSTALNFSFTSFVRLLAPILRLGVLLVVATAFAAAFVAAGVVPGLTMATAIVLGAAIAPPDAVSALAIGRELGLRRGVLVLLTGESLVNDAAALTLFTIAVASVTGSHTFIDGPILLFLYGAGVGAAVGIVLAVAAIHVRRRLRNPGLETVLGLVIPFAAYLLAEHLQASGVIAVVAAGFVVGTRAARFGYETRLQERQVWDAVVVLLEAFVFAYVGLQLRFVIDDVSDAGDSLWAVFGGGLVVLLAVMAVRPLLIFARLGVVSLVASGGDERARRRVERRNARRAAQGKAPIVPPEGLSWQEGVVISWTGMRGVVTLAAAAAIPATLPDGSPFPGRAEIQAIAFLVAVGTLLIQGATLPWLISLLGVTDPDEEEQRTAREQEVAVVARAAATDVYEDFVASPPDGLEPEVIRRAAERVQRARDMASAAAELDARDVVGVVGGLLRDVIAEQRRRVVDERDAGRLDDEAVREYLSRLDLEEAALMSRAGSRL